MTIHLRAAAPRPTSFDPDARTIEAIVSTGADTVRPGYIERLDLTGADISRLIGGPVLDGHRSGTTSDQLGVVEKAEIRPEGLWVLLRFRSSEAAQQVMTDISDGTLRGLSVGYTVSEWLDGREGKNRTRTAKKWTLLEVSVVPMPADPGAHFRNGDGPMSQQEQITEQQDQGDVLTRAQVNAEIRTIASTAGLTRSWADAQIDAEASPEDARRDAFEAMQQRTAETTTRTTRIEISTDNTAPDVIARRYGEALYARSHPDHDLSPEARQYANTSTVDIARDCLRRSGIAVGGMSASTVITRALHSTSDFPLITGDAVGRELRRAYMAAPSGVRQLARQTTARDFRAKRAIQFGEAPQLEKVSEGGEFKHGTIEESAELYSVETFGKIFGISRQALINDDLGAFTQIPAKMGTAARAFEAQQLVAKLIANPDMSDGDPVFDANHANVTAAAAPSLTTLSAARLAMRKQTGLAGEQIDVTPRFVVVPPDLETTAEQVLAEIAATKTADANPFANLTLIVEPRLTDPAAWYVAADPAVIDGLEYAYLEGAPGPQIETRQGFEVDGVQIKVRLDFGAGWVDHRGWHKVG